MTNQHAVQVNEEGTKILKEIKQKWNDLQNFIFIGRLDEQEALITY